MEDHTIAQCVTGTMLATRGDKDTCQVIRPPYIHAPELRRCFGIEQRRYPAHFPSLEWFVGHTEQEQYTTENTANCGNIEVRRQYWTARIPNLVPAGVPVIIRMQISRNKSIPTTDILAEKA